MLYDFLKFALMFAKVYKNSIQATVKGIFNYSGIMLIFFCTFAADKDN